MRYLIFALLTACTAPNPSDDPEIAQLIAASKVDAGGDMAPVADLAVGDKDAGCSHESQPCGTTADCCVGDINPFDGNPYKGAAFCSTTRYCLH